MSKFALVLTCEHAGNQIPEAFAYLFSAAKADLESHLGWDPGSLFITQELARELDCDYHAPMFTRLLIEVNRSIGHPQLFSSYTKNLSPAVKRHLIKSYYESYRKAVINLIREKVEREQTVLHLSIHTFTPAWNGKEREVEVGLLFDGEREGEKVFCESWLVKLQGHSKYKIRLNEPYNGADDGFTTFLRTKFDSSQYLGIEVEVNQKFVNSGLEEISKALRTTLKSVNQ